MHMQALQVAAAAIKRASKAIKSAVMQIKLAPAGGAAQRGALCASVPVESLGSAVVGSGRREAAI